jgi:hydroxyethylthiazole kinase-like uncharacterized protein yjeF
LIRLQTLEPAFYAAASQLQSVMASIWQPANKLAGDHTAVLVGPGLAADDLPDQLKLLTRHLWRDSVTPVIADASALDWLTLGPLSRTGARVITPHPGEAARLLQSTPQHVQADRVGALRSLSHRFGHTWVVLKGHQTLVGRSSGEIYVNPSGNPYLAQGGSGDVLAGYLAGFLAQPAIQADPLKAIRYAVWAHGAAADRLQNARPGWVIEELVEEIGNRTEK